MNAFLGEEEYWRNSMVYMGSKNRIAKYLCPIIQEKIDLVALATFFIDFFTNIV